MGKRKSKGLRKHKASGVYCDTYYDPYCDPNDTYVGKDGKVKGKTKFVYSATDYREFRRLWGGRIASMRAGREPAEDVKKRIVAACQEAGLKIQAAKMILRHDHDDCVIYVSAATPDEPCQRSSVEIPTIVRISGAWSGKLDIRCAATEDDYDPDVWEIPVMRGRTRLSLCRRLKSYRPASYAHLEKLSRFG